MTDKTVPQIAAEVSLLMQLDRMRHHVGTEIDMKALGNVPDYIASVFEGAHAVAGELTPAAAYDLINKRVSRIEAQLYLMRLELENRSSRDPARIFEDPLAISAYGARMESLTTTPKSFSFEAPILAQGWYPLERSGTTSFRWMRPQAGTAEGAPPPSIACVPHLGTVDQLLEIHAHVLRVEQYDGLEIRAGSALAEIRPDPERATMFTARLRLSAKDLQGANYLPVEFRLKTFLQPSPEDPRLLGINVSRFSCLPILAAPAAETPSA